MKLKLIRLYSEPQIFKPIEFHDGLNFIMGEKVEEEDVKKGKKTNGVGKSMCMEFIDFCLLRDTNKSRVMKIPLVKFSEDTQIILNLEINGHNICIIRTKHRPENPIISINGTSTEFSSLDDAREELKKLIFSEFSEDIDLSFREFLDPFMREENSEFKDVLLIYGSAKQVKPHAFLFGLNVSLIKKIQEGFREIEKVNTHKNKLKDSLTENGTRISDVKATINSLNNDLVKIESALESFKSNDAYESQQEDLVKIQLEIDELRSRQSALMFQLKSIKNFPALEVIKKSEIEIMYNQFKSGLGDMIVKSVEEVIAFKEKIDEFQKKLIHEKVETLNEDLKIVTKQLQTLEDVRIEKMQIIDQKGALKDIKNAYAIFHQKKDSHSRIQSKYEDYERTDKEWKDLKLEKDKAFQALDASLFEARNIIDSFNKTILIIHEYIMDSNVASFDIKTINTNTKSKQILSFDMRIDDDGSHSINRMRVFIYDLALLLNEFTQKRHPHFLVHDNILEVDGDTLEKSIDFLIKKEDISFQYIITLNQDELQKITDVSVRNKIENNIKRIYEVAHFTKQNRFLYGEKYSEEL